jgi:ssDNA-binding replication factor A large subunit
MAGKDGIIASILQSTSMKREDVDSLILRERQKYSGLLTEDGAALLVAGNLNVKLDSAQETSKISLVNEGMHGINLTASLSYVSPLKRIRRGEKEFSLLTVLLADSSGEITIKLWDSKAQYLISEKAERGDCVEVKNAYVSSYKGVKEINLGFDSEIRVAERQEGLPLPQKILSVPDLKSGMKDIDLYCRIRRIFSLKTFKKDFREGKLLSFEVENSSKASCVRAVAWNDAVEGMKDVSAGAVVKIEAADVRENQGNPELHLSWRSRVIPGPKMDGRKKNLPQVPAQ